MQRSEAESALSGNFKFTKAGLCRVNKSQNLGKKPSDRSREPVTAKTVSKNNHSTDRLYGESRESN